MLTKTASPLGALIVLALALVGPRAVMAQGAIPGVPTSPTSSIVNDNVMRNKQGNRFSLYNGNNLLGWRGSGWTSASDKTITAGNGANLLTSDSTIVSNRVFKNFELEAKVLATSAGIGTNRGGIEFLQTTFTDVLGVTRTVTYHFSVGTGVWGGLRDAGTRNRLIRLAPVSPVKNAIKNPQMESYALWAFPVVNENDWNDLRLVVEFPRIRGWVNDVIAFDYMETDFEILKGVRSTIASGQPKLALKAMSQSDEIKFDDIFVTRLSDDELVPLGNPDLSKVGRWLLPEDTGVMGINSHVLPNGKVLLHDSTEITNRYTDNGTWRNIPGGTPRPSMVALWDPETNTVEGLEEWFLQQTKDVEIFCSGHTVLPDGKIVFHGNTQAGRVAANPRTTWRATVVYDWKTNTWSRTADTNRAGYYPTVVETMTGDAMVFAAGTPQHGKQRPLGDHTEVYNYQTKTWRNIANDASWVSLNNILGDLGRTHRAFGFQQGLVREQSVYYNLALMPGSGKILHVGGPSHLVAVDHTGAGGAEYISRRENIVRHYGTHQIIGNGKVLLAGGASLGHRYGSTGGDWDGDQSLPNSAEIIDMSANPPTSVRTGDMQEGRSRSSSSLLADGSVIYTGGHDLTAGDSYADSAIGNYAWAVAKLRPEIWNPQTGSWSEMVPQQRRRQYHSVAALLPDGRIMTAGSGYPRNWNRFTTVFGYQSWDDYTVEIYEPPYLFDQNGNYATRPEFLWTPTCIGYQHQFAVVFAGNVEVSKMHLIKLSSQTHNTEMSARLVELKFIRLNSQRVRVMGLEDSTIAPPGHYMLFVVNDKGVPSKGKIVKVDGHLSVHVVAKSSRDALAKKGTDFVANQKVGTADFVHGDPLQSWQMYHGVWSGDNYRFLSRFDGTAMDMRFVTGWGGYAALNTQTPSVDADALPSQSFSLTNLGNAEYRIDCNGLTLDSYFARDYQGRHSDRDEIILHPYDGRINHRYYIYPTNSPLSIRLVDSGGALASSFGNLQEEGDQWIVLLSRNTGRVQISLSTNGLRLTLNSSNFPTLVNSNGLETDWVIDYLPKGQVQLIHAQTGLALTASRPNLGASPMGGTSVATTPKRLYVQVWRLAN